MSWKRWSLSRLTRQLRAGTTTVEAKSGYGLSQAEELRHLRIIGRVAARVPIRVVATFLGAHAKPPDRPDYVDEIVDAMLPAVAAEGLAEFCDVFCDAGFFTVEEAERILRAASAAGLGTRLHADQLQRIGATALAVRLGATSADHLEQLDAEGVRLLAASPTVATLLPGPALVMRDRLPPARALLDAGATVALASDANAGTFGAWGAMPLVIGLGSTLLGMTALEAVHAATLGGAAALGLGGERGQLAPGAVADLVAWDAEHEGAFALHLGSVRPLNVLVAGEVIAGNALTARPMQASQPGMTGAAPRRRCIGTSRSWWTTTSTCDACSRTRSTRRASAPSSPLPARRRFASHRPIPTPVWSWPTSACRRWTAGTSSARCGERLQSCRWCW